MKNIWRLTERLFFYQGCKEYPHGIGIKVKIPIRSSLLNGTQKRREITWAEILPGEWVIWAKYWALQHWNPTPGRWIPLASWRAGETNRRARGSLDFPCEEHMLAFSWNKVESVNWNCTRHWPVSGNCPGTSAFQPCLLHPRGELHCEDKATQAWSGIWAGIGGRDSHYW